MTRPRALTHAKSLRPSLSATLTPRSLSGLDYAVVRSTAQITGDPEDQDTGLFVEFGQGDAMTGGITRPDLAQASPAAKIIATPHLSTCKAPLAVRRQSKDDARISLQSLL